MLLKMGNLSENYEEMYQSSTEVPWHQDETAYGIFSDLDITILNHMHKRYDFKTVADVGCGLGFFTNRIYREVWGGISNSRF